MKLALRALSVLAVWVYAMESQKPYQHVFEANPLPMWVYDPKTLAILAVNDAAIKHYGYTRDEFLALTISDLRPPDAVPDLLDYLERKQAPGLNNIGLWKHRKKDGTLIDVEVTVNDLSFQGQPARLVLAHDVTERQRAEEALREGEARYRALAETSAMGIWQVDAEGRTIYINPAMCAMLEIDGPEAVAGKTYHGFLTPESLEVVAAEHAKRRQGLTSSYEMEIVGQRGRKCNVVVSGAPLLSADGRVQSLIGTFADITERKRAEAALQASEDRYRELFENATDIIYTHDLAGNFTSVNKAGEKIIGYSRQEVLTMNATACITPEYAEQLRQIAASKAAGTAPSTLDLEIAAKDGRRLALEVSIQAIYQDGRPVGVQGIARDVSERKRLEAQLRHAQKMESIGTLAGGVAHDFNNILTGILGFSDLAMRDLSPQHPLYKNLQGIQRLSDRAAQLTRQLLTFARQQMLEPKPIHLHAVISDLRQFIQNIVGEQIELQWRPSDDLASLYADVTQIEQVVMNLCINARDAMPQGGTLTIQTQNACLDESFCRTHPWAKPGRYVCLTVRDTGIGFDRITQERIFDPFFTTKGPDKGTGLGLAIVYAIVHQHRGLIDVQSQVGQGTMFKIYLPAAATASAAMERPSARSASGGQEMILVAEDEAVVRDLIVQILQKQSYRVLIAQNGEEALRMMETYDGPLDLIISDAVMPKLGGRQLYELLHPLRPGLKFLFISGYSVQTLSEAFLHSEQVEFLHKPFKPADLVRKVRAVLDKIEDSD